MIGIPRWRLALTGAAIVVLTIVGVGLATATSTPSSTATSAALGAPNASSSAAPNAAGNRPGHPALRRLLRRLAARPGARRLVDGQLTFTDKSGSLTTFQLDRGTIHAIGNGTLTIDEAGGKQVTVTTDGDTVVRLGDGSGKGTLGDLKAGDQVFVQSRVDNGSTLAKHILRIPASVAAPAASAGA